MMTVQQIAEVLHTQIDFSHDHPLGLNGDACSQCLYNAEILQREMAKAESRRLAIERAVIHDRELSTGERCDHE